MIDKTRTKTMKRTVKKVRKVTKTKKAKFCWRAITVAHGRVLKRKTPNSACDAQWIQPKPHTGQTSQPDFKCCISTPAWIYTGTLMWMKCLTAFLTFMIFAGHKPSSHGKKLFLKLAPKNKVEAPIHKKSWTTHWMP